MKKQVGYSYASSVNAVKLGFKCGCYSISMVPEDKPPLKAFIGFNTLEEAKEYADNMTEEYARYSL